MEFLAQIAKEYGLFVALVVYVLWDGRQREGRYISIIEVLSDEIKDRLMKIETKLNIRGSKRGNDQ